METPEFFHGTSVPVGVGGGGFNYNSQEKNAVVDQFIIDDLLVDFPNDDDVDVLVADDAAITATNTTTTVATEYSSVDGGGGVNFIQNSSNSSFSGSTEPSSNFLGGGGGDMGCRNFSDGQFSSELCVPYDDLAELEWLSNFVEESFSSEDLQKLQLISGMNARTTDISQTHHVQQPQPNRAKPTAIFKPDMAVPAKARSKRSRAPPCNWTSRLLAVSPSPPPSTIITVSGGGMSVTPTMSSSSESDIVGKKKVVQKKKEISDNGLMTNNEGRKCLHCATDKTPQWRTGPMGPKTLCNACGVRYKSGRLVPEYRPAASPTFVLTKHSNSHRKVVELRRQKEFIKAQQHHPQQPQQQQQFLHQNMMFDVSHGDDFLIHQHLGSDFRQLI